MGSTCSTGPMNSEIEDRAVTEIGETHATLRLVFPRAEAAMVRSVEMYGQLSPVVCAPAGKNLEIIDGFKRLRALRKLSIPTIRVVRLDTTLTGSKAGMIHLNRVAGSLTDFEEAMILQSLHRDDKLSQVELSTMLGRDKSWVSRRIALIERLCDEGRRHLQLGLISPSIGRELIKLARANQLNALKAILKHHLGKRETGRLVHLLLTRPTWAHENILYYAWDALSPDWDAPRTPEELFNQLSRLVDLQRSLSNTSVSADELSPRQVARVKAMLRSSGELAQSLAYMVENHAPEDLP